MYLYISTPTWVVQVSDEKDLPVQAASIARISQLQVVMAVREHGPAIPAPFTQIMMHGHARTVTV